MQSDGGVLYTQIESQLPTFIQNDHPQFTKFIEKYYEFLELNLITFTDLDLNEYKPLQESADVNYTVTVTTGNNVYSNSANKFYLDGAVSPDLTIDPTKKTIFDQGDTTVLTHYLRISTTPDGTWGVGGEDLANTEVTYFSGLQEILFKDEAGNQLVTEGGVDFVAELNDVARTIIEPNPDNSGKIYYYYCNVHAGMGGKLTFSNTSAYISLENGNTESANTNSNYIDYENANRQGEQFLSGETIEGANSGATGIVRGKYSTTQVYVEESNQGQFEVGETIEGLDSRVSANVSSYSRQPINASRNIKAFQDIDKAPAGFVELFRKEFLQGIPQDILANKREALKHIKDFYRAKGNENSFRYIFRLLYGKENISFYYPSTDILRLSDGRWTLDKSIKIATDIANNIGAFVGRKVVGEISNVEALIERSQGYQIGASGVTEFYLSSIDANNAIEGYTTFKVDETITTTTADDDGNYGSANTTGVLSGITIDAGGSNYLVGNDILVSGGGGAEAAAKVASVSDATISNFNIIDSGDGFTVGDTVSFVNEGTGGTGGAARINSIIPTFTTVHISDIINTFKDNRIDSAGYNVPWQNYTRNNHITSNTTTTFTAAIASGTAPKEGDLIISFQIPQILLENREGNIVMEASTPESGAGFRIQTEENTLGGELETIRTYTPDRSRVGTVISTNTTASPSTVTYASGSVLTSDLNGAVTIRTFAASDTVTIFDLTKKADGTAITSSGNAAAFYATGGSFVVSGTPTANTDLAERGLATITNVQLGAIRGIQILSSGQGYVSIPQVTVANTIIESYKADVSKTGANSVFVQLAGTTANQFIANTRIENDAQTAIGTVLDFIDTPTTTTLATGGSVVLVATGNTHLRVQMTTANSFVADERLTTFKNEAGGAPMGIGDFTTANITVSSTTGTFTQATHGYSVGQKVNITGVSTGVSADDTIFNKLYAILTIPTTSTYTVTLSGAPTTQAVNNATIRKAITANTSSTNTVFANTGIPGNNAVISIAAIAIGAIESLTITNFGANYTSSPTLDATGSGDGNATLSAQLGSLAEYAGYFDGNYGLLSTTGKFQDNYYYQDFSYVIKTDVDVKTYRDKIINLVHPAGMILFGEIAITSNTIVKMFGDAIRNVDTTIANTVHGIDVPLYRHHDIEIINQNTVSSNLVHSIANTLYLPALYPPTATRAIDAKAESATNFYDLILEQSADGVALENFGDILIYENSGDILLEEDIDGRDRIIEETADFILMEDGSILILEVIDVDANLIFESGDHPITESGYDILDSSANQLLQQAYAGQGFDVENPLFHSGGVQEMYLEMEVSVGRATSTRSDLLSYFTLEYDSTDTVKIMQEQDHPSYILHEDFDGVIDLEGLTPSGDSIGNLFTEEDSEQHYALMETEKVSYHLSSDNFGTPEFNITAEEHGIVYYIRQEPGLGADSQEQGDYIIVEGDSGDRIVGFDSADEITFITMERHDWVEPLIKVEETSNGYSLPIIKMPFAETGSVKIDFGPAYDLLLEDGSYLILEDPNAQAYPTYLAFENTMQEEVSKDYVVTVASGTVNLADGIGLEDGTGVIEIEATDDIEIQLEDASGYISLEDGSGHIKLEASTPGLQFNKILSEAGGDVMSDVRRQPIDITLTPKLTVKALTSELVYEDTNYPIGLEESTLVSIGLQDGTGSIVVEGDSFGFIVYEDEAVAHGVLVLEQEDIPYFSITSGSSVFQHTATWGRIDEFTILGSIISAQVGGKEEFVALESVDIAQAGVILLEDDSGKVITERSVIPSFPDIQPLEINIPLSTTKNQAPGDEIVLEDGSGSLMQEGDYIGLEDGTGGIGLEATYGRLTEEDFGQIRQERRQLINEMNWARVESDGAVSSYLYEAQGELSLTGGEEFELLAENGDKFVTESVETFDSVSAMTSEAGEYFVQESDQSSRIIGEFSADVSQTSKIITADYGRRNEAIGTGTQFEVDFASPITLEDYEDHLYNTSGGGVMLIENHTSQSYLLIHENTNDRIYESVLLEDTTTSNDNISTEGRLLSEDKPQSLSQRLVYHELLDLVTEEDNILTEELDHILFEDHLIVPQDINSLLAENGDDYILEHDANHNYAAQLIGYGIENIAYDFKINDFVAEMGLEFDINKGELPGSILMESYTPHNTIDGQIVVGANTYVQSWSDGLLIQASTKVDLSDGATFPYGVEGGTLRYANGFVTDITDLNNNRTQLTVGNSATVSAPQTFRIYYGSDETVPIETPRKLKCELYTTDTNDTGREYQFLINDWLGLTIQAFHERHGNDIVYEDGERVLIEDGHLQQQENTVLLEWNDNIILEDGFDDNVNALLNEEGGYVVIEELLQEDSVYKLGYEGDSNLLFEDIHYNEKMLIHDAERFRIKEIANNTSMIMSSTETDVQTPRSDITFFIEREGRITS